MEDERQTSQTDSGGVVSREKYDEALLEIRQLKAKLENSERDRSRLRLVEKSALAWFNARLFGEGLTAMARTATDLKETVRAHVWKPIQLKKLHKKGEAA